jgi:hypothetical protein
VHICAPSNAAIDEILTRINASGLIGLHHFRGSISREFVFNQFEDFKINAEPFDPRDEKS